MDREKAIKEAEQHFARLMSANNIKSTTKTYLKYQQIFFNGAYSILGGEFPARWGVAILADRVIPITLERKDETRR